MDKKHREWVPLAHQFAFFLRVRFGLAVMQCVADSSAMLCIVSPTPAPVPVGLAGFAAAAVGGATAARAAAASAAAASAAAGCPRTSAGGEILRYDDNDFLLVRRAAGRYC